MTAMTLFIRINRSIYYNKCRLRKKLIHMLRFLKNRAIQDLGTLNWKIICRYPYRRNVIKSNLWAWNDRFHRIVRFKTEGRGTLHGLNSSKEVKTSPTIQIVGYQGPAKVLISCVEESEPHRAHPHQLIGKGECKDGNFSIFIKMLSWAMLCFTLFS